MYLIIPFKDNSVYSTVFCRVTAVVLYDTEGFVKFLFCFLHPSAVLLCAGSLFTHLSAAATVSFP